MYYYKILRCHEGVTDIRKEEAKVTRGSSGNDHVDIGR